MNKEYSKAYVIRFVLIAVFFSLIIWFGAVVVDIISKNFPFNFASILAIHKYDAVLYLVDFFPFLVGFLSYYFAKNISIRETESNAAVDFELSRSRKLYRFVEKLNQGNISADYKTEETDVLGGAIVKLRNNLQNSLKEEEARRNEDERRNWSAEGLAKFGDILRSSTKDMEELAYSIVSNLVSYIGANQGGFYFLNDNPGEERYFQLVATYAYERRKYSDTKIDWGEGMVGACAMERETVHMTKVPDTYLNITSGLGKANPRAVLLVPMIVNEELHGVIELATFNKFEKHTIEFIEKVAENVASTISNVKVNMRTASLLEESQKQAEALAEKEEQMRQNMEELQATQEEAARQGEKFISFTNSVNHTMIRAEYSTDGSLLYANTKFLQKLGYSSNSEVEGKHISMFLNEKDRIWFNDIWDTLAKGGKHFEGDMKHMTKQGLDLWTIATYTCVRRADGMVDKVLFLAIDTTEQKKLSLDYEGQIQALNRSSIKIDFNLAAEIVSVNELFLDTFGYQDGDIDNLTLSSLVFPMDRKNVERTWDDVTNGIPFDGMQRFKLKDESERWFRVTFSVVHDMYGDVAKVVFIANDMTKEKMMELENKHQTEILKEQEEILKQNEVDLNKRLDQAKQEIKDQFKEVEKVKILNEKTLEGFLDAIVTIDDKGIVQFFNKAAEALWELDKNKIIGQNINILFPAEAIEQDEVVKAFVTPGMEKSVGDRREINIVTSQGDEIPVLMLLSMAEVGKSRTYTAFIQNIEVELF